MSLVRKLIIFNVLPFISCKPLKNLDLLMTKNQGISRVYNITVSEKLLKHLQNPLYNPLKNKRKK